jgi:hypothetical protein
MRLRRRNGHRPPGGDETAAGAPGDSPSRAPVAPAPEVDQQSPRSAHGFTVFAIAVAGLFVTAFAMGRNWRLARSERAARHPHQARGLGAPGVASTFRPSPRSSGVEGAT